MTEVILLNFSSAESPESMSLKLFNLNKRQFKFYSWRPQKIKSKDKIKNKKQGYAVGFKSTVSSQFCFLK